MAKTNHEVAHNHKGVTHETRFFEAAIKFWPYESRATTSWGLPLTIRFSCIGRVGRKGLRYTVDSAEAIDPVPPGIGEAGWNDIARALRLEIENTQAPGLTVDLPRSRVSDRLELAREI